jgi:hypothetical protein
MVRKENKKLISRLFNYKFRTAQQYLEGEDEEVIEVVNALAETFDNCGWIDGNMDVIIQACVSKICPQVNK